MEQWKKTEQPQHTQRFFSAYNLPKNTGTKFKFKKTRPKFAIGKNGHIIKDGEENIYEMIQEAAIGTTPQEIVEMCTSSGNYSAMNKYEREYGDQRERDLGDLNTAYEKITNFNNETVNAINNIQDETLRDLFKDALSGNEEADEKIKKYIERRAINGEKTTSQPESKENIRQESNND